MVVDVVYAVEEHCCGTEAIEGHICEVFLINGMSKKLTNTSCCMTP